MGKQIIHIQNLSNHYLSDHEIHIWFTAMPQGKVSEDFLDLLDAKEKLRFASYKVPGKQKQFLFGRYFLKQTLSLYLNTPPKNIELSINRHKRPFLRDQHLQFNLSHSYGAFALIVSKNLPVGIDIEYRNRKILIKDGRHVFMEKEINSMQSKSAQDAKQEFLKRWTLKEAIYKATDQGPELLFNEFAVDLDLLSVFSKSPYLAPINREIEVFTIMEDFVLAYAIENSESRELEYTYYHWKKP